MAQEKEVEIEREMWIHLDAKGETWTAAAYAVERALCTSSRPTTLNKITLSTRAHDGMELPSIVVAKFKIVIQLSWRDEHLGIEWTQLWQ